MINKELLNICYKFFNRFITADILIEQLSNINTTELSKNDINEINKLINEIKIISNNIPNKVDDYVLKKKENLNNLIKKLDQIPNDNEFLDRQLDNLKKEYDKEMDSHERWFAITDCIDKSEYFTRTFESLTDYELLEFIAQNIQAPFPPNITQEKFDKLVKVGVEKDEREWLWRLAFNYDNHNINFDSIVDYFIKVKDGYYLSELICAVSDSLDIDNIINKIDDKELIKYLIEDREVLNNYISEKQFSRLKEKYNE